MLRTSPHRPGSAGRRDDEGTTLAELLVTMVVLSLFLAAIASMTLAMLQVGKRTRDVADASTRARAVFDQVSRQLPAAAQINPPQRIGDDWYLEAQFDPRLDSGTQTCMQWRLLAADHALQVRDWATTAPGAPAWRTVSDGIVNQPGTQPPFAVLPPDDAFRSYRVLVDVVVDQGDAGTARQRAQFALTNTSESTDTSTVCTEVGRS